jgi:nicotinamide-nucleotide amidase
VKVEIITIGDEILIGQIVDTNSAWMAVELNRAGFEIVQISSVHDDEIQIADAVLQAFERADVVLTTGGIGPTKDDITKNTLCKIFGAQLVFNQDVYNDIEFLLRNRSRAMNELTKTQAMVPDKARIIRNTLGTAPITWFDHNHQVLVSMPGVPYEMKEAMLRSVIPMLKERFDLPEIIHRHFMVQGYPESALAIKIADWEGALPQYVKLAYLPNFNIVRLRLSTQFSEGVNETLDNLAVALREILGDAILAEVDLTAEELMGQWLLKSDKTLTVAESCTGGFLAHRITSVPGSSAWFRGGVVAYANEVKESVLGVDSGIIQQFGAVSREVVEQMAGNVKKLLRSDFALAISGIAGPGGGTDDKPVGTTWIALSSENSTISREFRFSLKRQLNIERATQSAMLLLLDELRRS